MAVRHTPVQAKRKSRLTILAEEHEQDSRGDADRSEVTLNTIDSGPTVDSTFSALAKKASMGSSGHGGREHLGNRSWAALTSGIADSGWGSR